MSHMMMMQNYPSQYSSVNQPTPSYVVQPPYMYNPLVNQQMMLVPQYSSYAPQQAAHQPVYSPYNPAPASSPAIPSSAEVRVSFSSMLVHPHLSSVIYYQLRADGHNQDLIIEHPTGWSIVKPEAEFVEHLLSSSSQARIAREKWPTPHPMQLTFKSCDTSRLMPERTVTRYTVSRYSQMEWKEAMKAVKSLKDDEVVRAKMRVRFGLYRGSPNIDMPQPPVVLYESLILLGWRTTRSGVKRRAKQPTPSIKGEPNDPYVPELVLDPADSAVSTPSSQGSAISMNMLNQFMMDRSSNKRAREVQQQITQSIDDQSIEDFIGDSHVNKRVKLFGEPIKQSNIDQLPFIKEQP